MVDPRSGNYDNLPHVGPGNMESFTGRLYDNVNTVKDDALISGKFHFNPGDIIYGKINPQLGKYTYAQFEGLASADAYVLNGKNGLTQEFLFGILQTKAFFDYSVSVSMRSGMPKINRDELNAFEFLAPNESEQRAIGDILLKLDDLITLHQRECGKPPFNQSPAWEQRKLGDCFEFLKNNTLSRADLNGENGTARNVHYGDILIKFGDCLDGERSDLPFITDDTVLPKFAGSILREGDVIFADTAEDEAAGKCVELRKLPKEPTISGLHTIPARPRFPFGSGYLGHYLNSDAYHRQLLPLMQGIKVISVSKAALQDTQVRFPRLSEQAAIGAALSEIDNLITLHQRMCPIFSFCAHGSRTNFAQTLQGWLQILRYPRPIPKMLVSPSAPASGVFGTAKGAFICASSSAGASTSSPSARKNFITSSTLCCRESLSSP